MKKIYAAAAVVLLLIAAFMYGGSYGKGKTGPEPSAAVKTEMAAGSSATGGGANVGTGTATGSAAKNLTAQAVDTSSAALADSQTAEAKKTVNKTAEQKAEKTAKGKKDKYLTDPVPAGKPKPVEWQNVEVDKSQKHTCTMSITCKTILNNMDKFNKDKQSVLPADGVIYSVRTVSFSEGESVFDVLLRETKKNKIHMEFEMTPIYNSNYIEGINNLYEFDCGELSGWMYKVNGWFPNYGCSRYLLKDGDKIEWMYTCDLGRDIGGGQATGG